MCVACLAFRLFSCATPASVATIPSKIKKIKIENKYKYKKGAGCVVPARLCSPAVVHHQLLGASGLPISLTQPQLRPDPNQEWEGKHEVARSSICALTPSAVKPPLFLSFGSLLQLCITSFWVWEELPNSATPSLSCDYFRNQEWGGKHEAARWSICAITPSAVKPPTLLLLDLTDLLTFVLVNL